MRGLDTNVLLRFLTADDPVQAERVGALAGTVTFDRALRGAAGFSLLD